MCEATTENEPTQGPVICWKKKERDGQSLVCCLLPDKNNPATWRCARTPRCSGLSNAARVGPRSWKRQRASQAGSSARACLLLHFVTCVNRRDRASKNDEPRSCILPATQKTKNQAQHTAVVFDNNPCSHLTQ